MTNPTHPLTAQRARVDAERRALARLTLRELVERARDACTSTHTIRLELEPYTTYFTLTTIECAHGIECTDVVGVNELAAFHLEVDLSWDLASDGLNVAGDKASIRVSVALLAAAEPELPGVELDSLPAPGQAVGDFTLRFGEHLRVPVYVSGPEPAISGAHVAAVLAEAGDRGFTQTWPNESTVILHNEHSCEVFMWADDADGMWPIEPLLITLRMDARPGVPAE